MRIPAVVLAAGLSTRMRGNVGGEFKPLLEVGGRPLVRWVLDSLRGSGVILEVVLVVGYRGGEVEGLFRNVEGVRVVWNEDYEVGEMISSVKVGVGAVGDAAGFLLAFADQPAVDLGTVRALVEAYGSGEGLAHDGAWRESPGFRSGAPSMPPLVLPVFGDRKGHPVVISGGLVPEILALGRQETLKTVVQRHIDRAILVSVNDQEILEDLDTPEDVARWRMRISRGG